MREDCDLALALAAYCTALVVVPIVLWWALCAPFLLCAWWVFR